MIFFVKTVEKLVSARNINDFVIKFKFPHNVDLATEQMLLLCSVEVFNTTCHGFGALQKRLKSNRICE